MAAVKCVVVLLAMIGWAGQHTLCAVVRKGSSIEVGLLKPEDKFLFQIKSEKYPLDDNINVNYMESGVSSEEVLISYVNATEFGLHPDATVRIVEGGPGYNNVKFRCTSGLSKGFNYTIDIFGTELEKNTILSGN